MSKQLFPEKVAVTSPQASGDGRIRAGFQGGKKLQVSGVMLLIGFVGNWIPSVGLLAGGIAAIVWILWEKTLPANATKRGVIAGFLAGMGEFLAGGAVTSINLYRNTEPTSYSILILTFFLIYLPLAILAILTGALTGYLFGRKDKLDEGGVAKIEIAKPARVASQSAQPSSGPSTTHPAQVLEHAPHESYYGLSTTENDLVSYKGPTNKMDLEGNAIPDLVNQVSKQVSKPHLIIVPEMGLVIVIKSGDDFMAFSFNSPMEKQAATDFFTSLLSNGRKIKMVEKFGAVELL